MTGPRQRRLRARPPGRRPEQVAALEADRWRMFEDAQHEADTMFAQYQLSQLLASGGTVTALATAVLDELVRHDRASAGALWLAAPGDDWLALVATVAERSGDAVASATEGMPGVPPRFDEPKAAAAWCRTAGWYGVALQETRVAGEHGFEQRGVGFVALRGDGRSDPDSNGLPDVDGGRFLGLVRHELAIALRAAQLREQLTRERSLLSAILDGASDAIVAVDAARRVMRLNRAALSLLGDGDDARGIECRELLGCAVEHANGTAGPHEARLRCGERCPFEEVLAGSPPVDRELSVVGRTGHDVPVAASFARMSGADLGAVAVLRDLRAAHAFDELRSSFVAAVSHELRTPLALISGYVDTLLTLDLTDDARQHSIERIGEATTRLAELVDEILDVARLESDRLDLRRRAVPLASIVGRVAGEYADAPGTPPIDVLVPVDLPPVEVDVARIEQVLDNLVANAVKYGGGPGSRIAIGAYAGGSAVIVTVKDEGPGIDAADRARVFDRFYRGRRIRKGSAPGSGLGLYLCRRLIEAHGGRIWVDDVAHGTSISFSLPVAPQPARRRRRVLA